MFDGNQKNLLPLNRKAKIVAALSFLLQFLPYLLLQSNTYVRIHDTLEAEWIWYHVLAHSGHAFNHSSEAIVEQVMNGLNRNAFHTGWSFLMVWVVLLGSFKGYIFNYIVVHTIAFVGMYVLLRRHFLRGAHQLYIVLGVSLCFSWIPVFTALGLSVAGQPLVVYAFLNIIKKRDKWWDYLLIFLFPFYTSIVWTGPPMFGLLGIYLIDFFRKKRTIPTKYLGALVFMGVVYIAVNFQLFSLMFLEDFASHRLEYDYFYDKELSVTGSLLETIMVFLISHYHVGIFLSIPIIALMVTSFYMEGDNSLTKSLFMMIVGVCLFYGFYNWIVFLFGETIPLIKTFKFERAIILLPLLWCLLLAVVLGRLNQHSSYNLRILLILLLQFIMVIFSNDEFLHNCRQLAGFPKKPNFKSYFAAELFQDIDNYINKPKDSYRVVSVGMNPGIAQFNGFYTLDGLQALYKLEYKHQFRVIIAEELEKNQALKNYFDNWGNRCYIFSSELGKEDKAYMNGKDKAIELKELSLNTKAIKNMGGEYILSSMPINNHIPLNLQLEKIFEDKSSYWKIYLYKLKS